MASANCLRQIMVMNETMFPHLVGKDTESRELLLRIWDAVLTLYPDSQVEPAVMKAFAKSKFPIAPVDVVEEMNNSPPKLPYVNESHQIADLISPEEAARRAENRKRAREMLSSLAKRKW